MENTQIEFTRVNNDINGNPRYVCHFLNLLKDTDEGDISQKYRIALNRAKEIGGKKFHNKQYGGGIVFQSYNLYDTEKSINKLLGIKEEIIKEKVLNEFELQAIKDQQEHENNMYNPKRINY